MKFTKDYAKKISETSIQFAPISADLSDYTPYRFVPPVSTDIYLCTLSGYDVVDGFLQPIWRMTKRSKPKENKAG